MEISDILKGGKPVISFERPEITSSGSDLTKIGVAKINALRNSIQDINELIKEREDLSERFIQDGEDVKTQINNFLLENENTTEFEKADLMKEKNLLRSKKIEISEIQMKEKVDAWKDIALLKKELRAQEQELSEKQEEIKREIGVTVNEYHNAFNGAINAKTMWDFKEALDALGRERKTYSSCVQDLVSLGEDYPIMHCELNYLEVKN